MAATSTISHRRCSGVTATLPCPSPLPRASRPALRDAASGLRSPLPKPHGDQLINLKSDQHLTRRYQDQQPAQTYPRQTSITQSPRSRCVSWNFWPGRHDAFAGPGRQLRDNNFQQDHPHTAAACRRHMHVLTLHQPYAAILENRPVTCRSPAVIAPSGDRAVTLQTLTYAALAERLNISSEAARSLAKRQRLPRTRSNDGKTLVTVDFDEVRHKPMPTRSSGGDHPVTGVVATLKARIEALRAELTKLEATAAGHRADYERERDRADRLVTELLKATADAMEAKETAAKLEGEIAAMLRSSTKPERVSWWRWLRATG